MSEFPDKAPAREVGDPAGDPPFTWRVHPHDRPMDVNARRALRWAGDGQTPWVAVSGPVRGDLYGHDEVRDWPYTSDTVAGAAALLASRRASSVHGAQADERGDLDVTAFRTLADQGG